MMRILVTLCMLLIPAVTLAAGTPAGTTISNTVTVNYVAAGTPATTGASVSFGVHEIIDVIASWQDGANVPVASPSLARLLTFIVVNTGNGNEAFALSVFNGDATDQFDPLNPRIFLDNGNGVWDGVAVETLYQPGVNEPVLDANGVDRVTVFVVNDIPAALAVGALGHSRLDAQAMTPGAAGSAPGTTLPAMGDAGVDAVVGASGAQSLAAGTYIVNVGAPVSVNMTKSSRVISNPEGCVTPPCAPNPGAVIRYSIQVEVTGSGSVDNLVITDPIPANTGYVPGTITLDAAAKTDAVDADEAEFSAGSVMLNLATVTAPATRIITFDVTIN
ncbi:MAG: hypothetical protein OEZ10_10345 [Gammaproteobacteria bacterium]|nr:hypothetical protein [Gammaproteobacteria bacterium]